MNYILLCMTNYFSTININQGINNLGGAPQASVNGRQLRTSQLALQTNILKNPEKVLLQQARYSTLQYSTVWTVVVQNYNSTVAPYMI